MVYNPNGPLTVREVNEWFGPHPEGVAFCDPFMQAGLDPVAAAVERLSPLENLDPTVPPRAFAESEFLKGGFRFWQRVLKKYPDLEIGVLLSEARKVDDLDGAHVDEFEDELVANSGLVGYALGSRLLRPGESGKDTSQQHYGQRIIAAVDEFRVDVFNFDPLTINGIPTGPTEALVQGMDDKVHALAWKLDFEDGRVKAAWLAARNMWQWHALGVIGNELEQRTKPLNGPVLLVVPLEQLGLVDKVETALGKSDPPRVNVSAIRPEILPDDSDHWDDAEALNRGYIPASDYEQ